jgi:hypothetical protein
MAAVAWIWTYPPTSISFHAPRLNNRRKATPAAKRGLIEASGWLSEARRESKQRIESLTDDLAAPAYDNLTPSELHQLIADLEPISAALDAAGSR